MFLLVFLDTDQKASTGDPDSLGADYAIDLEPGSVGLFQWNGTNFIQAPSQTSLTFAYATTGATIRVSAADLGRAKGISFGVEAVSGGGRCRRSQLRQCMLTWHRTQPTASTRTRC
jgi:hypothetical protein